MTEQSYDNGWKKIRKVLVDDGFVEFYNDKSQVCLKKDKSKLLIPKKEILTPIFIKYVASVSRISKEKFGDE